VADRRRVDRDRTRHDVERNLSILAGFDIDPAAVVSRPLVACSAEAVAGLHALLRTRGAAPGAPLIAVANELSMRLERCRSKYRAI